MPPEFDNFLAALRAMRLPEEAVAATETALCSMGEECGDLIEAYRWIIGYPRRSIPEKLVALEKLHQRLGAAELAERSHITFNLRELTGWS
jgi:hypothetical protein